ncbi:DNA-directed RNA polymerase III subunit RPC7-like [Mercenaria mercenaria]|uniref:DNA-directed RNA polymerase III subunit RPC7-like n=1 Tax=Mercenaria mercenaria TaxID=6596 RepID=UPI00234FA2F5|nr:DNA-directed RNA polymerase III subunit RPC7-like [Mercenaria mercenaria]
MAGRGRGRGKTVSFDVQALGFGRGEALPAASLQPPPLFPTQEFKPVPLAHSEDYEYMLALKQEFIATLHKSPYYLKLDDKKRDIERYSDKYQLNQQDCTESLSPDWRRLPAELKVKERKVRKVKSSVKPNFPPRKKSATGVGTDANEIVKTLETLEKKEETSVEMEEGGGEKDEDEEEKEEDAEELEGEEMYDEDDLEEETDYAFSYFDNGEGYGDDDGDDDEGPIY